MAEDGAGRQGRPEDRKKGQGSDMVKSTFFSRFQDWLNDWHEAKTRQVLIVVLAVLLGVLLGMIIYTLFKGFIAPNYPGLYFDAQPEREELMKTVAPQVFLAEAAMWALGTLIGGYSAVRVAKMGQFPAWIVGVLLTAYFWIDMASLPSTLALFILCPIIVGLASYGAGWLGMYITVRKDMRAQA